MNDTVEMSIVYNNMGNISYKKKDYENALIFYKKCLKIQQKLYGIDHECTANTLVNIAIIYKNTNKLSEAEELYHKVIKMKESFYKDEIDLYF